MGVEVKQVRTHNGPGLKLDVSVNGSGKAEIFTFQVLKDKALLDLTFTHSDKTLSVTSLYQATDTLKGLGVKKLEYESKDTNDTLWKAGIKEGSVHSTEFVKERLFAAKELMAEQQRHNSG